MLYDPSPRHHAKVISQFIQNYFLNTCIPNKDPRFKFIQSNLNIDELVYYYLEGTPKNHVEHNVNFSIYTTLTLSNEYSGYSLTVFCLIRAPGALARWHLTLWVES